MAKNKVGPEGRDLSEHERTMLQPLLQQKANHLQALANLERQLLGMLALAEPEMLEEGSDLTFDPATLRFQRVPKK